MQSKEKGKSMNCKNCKHKIESKLQKDWEESAKLKDKTMNKKIKKRSKNTNDSNKFTTSFKNIAIYNQFNRRIPKQEKYSTATVYLLPTTKTIRNQVWQSCKTNYTQKNSRNVSLGSQQQFYEKYRFEGKC